MDVYGIFVIIFFMLLAFIVIGGVGLNSWPD